jgi:hypothetical protein
MTQTAQAAHVFSFELWPANLSDYPQYPILIPERTGRIEAASIKQAREIAAQIAADRKPGPRLGGPWVVGAASHIRGLCCPPHPGRDA